MNHKVLTYFVFTGLIFTIAFMPFFFGMMRPSMTDGNPYSIFFSLMNYPVTFALGGVIEWVASMLWAEPAANHLVMSQFYVSLAFWSILGGILGLSKDLRGNSGG